MSEDFAPGEEAIGDESSRGEGLRRHGSTWVGGTVLILIGVVFLVRNISGLSLDNWWALFILIPAITSLGNAWRTYRSSDRHSSAVRGSLVGGLMMLVVAMIFLFELDWGMIWPVFLIIAGLGGLLAWLLG